LLGFEAVYADRVYPNVYVQNIDLTGMTLEETNAVLAEALQYTTEGQIQFTYQDSTWEVHRWTWVTGWTPAPALSKLFLSGGSVYSRSA
jgi:hypothetical protein